MKVQRNYHKNIADCEENREGRPCQDTILSFAQTEGFFQIFELGVSLSGGKY